MDKTCIDANVAGCGEPVASNVHVALPATPEAVALRSRRHGGSGRRNQVPVGRWGAVINDDSGAGAVEQPHVAGLRGRPSLSEYRYSGAQ